MPTQTLTAAAVARIKPPKRGQLDYFDRGYPGLALRVSYGGARAWVYFYRLHGKLRRLSLGRHPGMSLVEAREAWRAARLAVSKGESPAHIRPTTADTFAAVADEWLRRDQQGNRSVREVRRVIGRDVNPVWGERLIAAIGRRDVIELIDGVVDRGATTMARRLHAHLHRLFRWAVGRGIIETNPMADLPRPGAAVKRDRVLTDAELAAIWKAAGKAAWPFGPAIKLLTLTACRRDEIGSLQWSEVHGDELRIPASRSKSGEPRVVPLSPAAAELIAALPRVGDRVLSANGRGISGWSKAKRALDAAAAEIAGAPLAPWRLHDLRRSTATNLQRLGVGLQTVESILGHVGGSRAGVVGIYQRHQFPAEQRAALEKWAAEIERIAAGQKAPVIHYAGALFAGGSEPSGLMVDVKPIDMKWVTAVKSAEAAGSFEPLLAYLRRPEVPQWGPPEQWWLRVLLERLQYKRKQRGKFVPLGQQSRREIHEIGAAYVRDLKARGEQLTHAAAIDMAVRTFPDFFAADAGLSLANFIAKHGTPRKSRI
jgi:integrase